MLSPLPQTNTTVHTKEALSAVFLSLKKISTNSVESDVQVEAANALEVLEGLLTALSIGTAKSAKGNEELEVVDVSEEAGELEKTEEPEKDGVPEKTEDQKGSGECVEVEAPTDVDELEKSVNVEQDEEVENYENAEDLDKAKNLDKAEAEMFKNASEVEKVVPILEAKIPQPPMPIETFNENTPELLTNLHARPSAPASSSFGQQIMVTNLQSSPPSSGLTTNIPPQCLGFAVTQNGRCRRKGIYQGYCDLHHGQFEYCKEIASTTGLRCRSLGTYNGYCQLHSNLFPKCQATVRSTGQRCRKLAIRGNRCEYH